MFSSQQLYAIYCIRPLNKLKTQHTYFHFLLQTSWHGLRGTTTIRADILYHYAFIRCRRMGSWLYSWGFLTRCDCLVCRLGSFRDCKCRVMYMRKIAKWKVELKSLYENESYPLYFYISFNSFFTVVRSRLAILQQKSCQVVTVAGWQTKERLMREIILKQQSSGALLDLHPLCGGVRKKMIPSTLRDCDCTTWMYINIVWWYRLSKVII